MTSYRQVHTAMRTSVFIATSLDGYLAREDGSLDWLMGHEEGDDREKADIDRPEDNGFDDFLASVDAVVMGRRTFDKVLTLFAGRDWYYGDKRVVVLTHRPLDVPEELEDRVGSMSGAPAEILERLSEQGIDRIYLDGGLIIQSFLRAGLVDNLRIFHIPVLIGTGVPLFGTLAEDIRLRLLRSRVFRGGAIEVEYEVERP